MATNPLAPMLSEHHQLRPLLAFWGVIILFQIGHTPDAGNRQNNHTQPENNDIYVLRGQINSSRV